MRSEAAWAFIDPIVNEAKLRQPEKYTAGTWGPVSSFELMAEHGHRWIEPRGGWMSLAQAITRALSETIARKSVARIALPGGRSAINLMSELSNESIDWSSVRVTLVDERAVDESSDASNARLVKSTLCVNHASDATFEPMLIGDDAASSADQLNQMERPLDIAILGMGDDGHFASLFPSGGRRSEYR